MESVSDLGCHSRIREGDRTRCRGWRLRWRESSVMRRRGRRRKVCTVGPIRPSHSSELELTTVRIALHSLQGALGKTSGRSYKAAPRQLLQVDPNEAGASPTLSPAHAHISKEDAVHKEGEGAAQEAAKLGRAALGNAAPVSTPSRFVHNSVCSRPGQTGGVVRKDPLTHRETLAILERMYDLVLEVEQLRRDQPPPEEEEAHQAW